MGRVPVARRLLTYANNYQPGVCRRAGSAFRAAEVSADWRRLGRKAASGIKTGSRKLVLTALAHVPVPRL